MYANVLNIYERGEAHTLPVNAREELGNLVSVHCRSMRNLQKVMLTYQWHNSEHGWGSLLAQQQHDMESWMHRMERMFEIEPQAVTWPQVQEASALGALQAEEPAVDGLALAARMMADFEALEQGIAQIWELAETYGADWSYGVLLGVGYFYHRSAGIYRQYLCASSLALGQAGASGVDWSPLGEE